MKIIGEHSSEKGTVTVVVVDGVVKLSTWGPGADQQTISLHPRNSLVVASWLLAASAELGWVP